MSGVGRRRERERERGRERGGGREREREREGGRVRESNALPHRAAWLVFASHVHSYDTFASPPQPLSSMPHRPANISEQRILTAEAADTSIQYTVEVVDMVPLASTDCLSDTQYIL